jgi:ligand-binding sensor domain-containing protein
MHSIAQSPLYKNFSIPDGLPSSMVYSSFQDSKGYMWFCTSAGVSRFDGYSFQTYTVNDGLTDNEVFNVFEDSKNRMWFLTFNGKICFLQDGKFHNSNNTPILKQIDSKSYFKSILEDSNKNIWLATDRSGIICLSRTNVVTRYFQTPLLEKTFYIYEAGDGSILAVVGMGVYDVRTTRPIITQASFTQPMSLNRVRCTYMGNDSLLISVFDDLYFFNSKTRSVEKIASKIQGLILNIVQSRKGVPWVCTMRGAFLPGTEHQRFLSDKSITSVLEDSEGNTWFTSLGKGVFFSSALDILNYTEDDGLPVKESYCLSVDKAHNLWVGQERGWLSKISNGKISSYRIKEEDIPGAGVIASICHSAKTLWMSSLDFGVAKFENKKVVRSTSANGEKCIISDKMQIKIGGAFGIIDAEEEAFKRCLTDMNNATGNARYKIGVDFYTDNIVTTERVHRLFTDSAGRTWVGLIDGLGYMEKDSLINFSTTHPQVRGRVTDMDQSSDGAIWASTLDNGLFIIKDESIIHLTQQDGLLTNNCRSISFDKEGNAWIATSQGINCVTRADDKFTIDFLNVNKGLMLYEVNDLCVVGDTLWLATTKGIGRLHKNFKSKTYSTPIYIKNFFVLGKNRAYNKYEDEILEYEENSVKINYEAISFRHHGSPLQYRYKFGEADTAWHYTTNTSIEFPLLRPGPYNFQVGVQNNDGSWSNKPAFVHFVIQKPFWQTYWFLSLLGVIFVAIVWLIFSLRFKHLKRREKMLRTVTESKLKALRAQMDPHFMFNSLMAIQNLVKKGNNEEAKKYIAHFAKLMRLTLENSRDEFVPLSNEIETLRNYLELQLLRKINSFEYSFDIDPEIDVENVSIPPMLAQPFIENALEHGIFPELKKGLIKVSIRRKDDYLVLEIEDNGVGLKQSMVNKNDSRKEHKSLATTITKERLALLNGGNDDITFTIEDLMDVTHTSCGTRVKIQIPFLTLY